MISKTEILAAAALAALFSAGVAPAQEGTGIGIIVGEPTGLSAKKWLDNRHAVDAGVAWSFSENDSFHLHADYLVHDFTLLKPTDLRGRMPVYYGLGGRIKFQDDDRNHHGRNDDDTLIGVRIPLGVAYYPENSSIDLFAEIVPIMDLVPDTHLDLNLSIGGRFYFK
jgi:hypothetical protein